MVNLGVAGSWPVHFVRSFLQSGQSVLTAPAAHFSLQTHFSGSSDGFSDSEGFSGSEGFSDSDGFSGSEGFSDSDGFAGSDGFSDSEGCSGSLPVHCVWSVWQRAHSGLTKPSRHFSAQEQAAGGSSTAGAIHRSMSAAQAGHWVLWLSLVQRFSQKQGGFCDVSSSAAACPVQLSAFSRHTGHSWLKASAVQKLSQTQAPALFSEPVFSAAMPRSGTAKRNRESSRQAVPVSLLFRFLFQSIILLPLHENRRPGF